MKLTVPICDAAGQPAPANCAAVHACRPLATPGESVVPTGSAISARLTCESPFSRRSVTVAPLGTARCVVSSLAVTEGWNGPLSQLVGMKVADARALCGPWIVVTAGSHDVGNVMNVPL